MSGTVSTRHLFTHSFVIVREFGLSCFAHCIWRTLTEHDHPVTFLECVAASGALSKP